MQQSYKPVLIVVIFKEALGLKINLSKSMASD